MDNMQIEYHYRFKEEQKEPFCLKQCMTFYLDHSV